MIRLKVIGRLGGKNLGTVTIDRERSLFSVRPYRDRREYTLPLLTVADMVLSKVIKAEFYEKVSKKKGRKK